MGVASWAVPVGVLAAIVVVAFVFVWWWFPRAWNKGNKKEAETVLELSDTERELRRQKNREVIERFTRARAIERGEIVEPAPEPEPEQLPAYEPRKANADVQEGQVVR